MKALAWLLRKKPLLLPAIALLAFAAPAAPAFAEAQHYIHLRTTPNPVVGQPQVFAVEGTVAPPAEYWDQSWIEVVVLPGSLGGCTEDAQSASAVAEQIGQILAIALVPHADDEGNFLNAVAFTPREAGRVWVCAYLYNEVGYTWTGWDFPLDVAPAPAAPPPANGSKQARPANLTKPWVTRARGRLICHPGTWSNANGTYAYNWLYDGHLTAVTGRRPYPPGVTGRGHRVSCRVTAYGPGGTAKATSRSLRLR